MAFEQHFYFGDDNSIASAAVVKHAHLVIQLAVPINTDCYSDAMFRQELNDWFCQQSCVGRQAELDSLVGFLATLFGIGDTRLQQVKVEKSFTTKERHVDGRTVRGFL